MFKKYYTATGLTLIEVLVSIGLFSIFSSLAFSVGINYYESNQFVLKKNKVYDEVRILLEKVVREARVGTIDYYEYFSRIKKSEEVYGMRPGQYEMHFYHVTDYDDNCLSNCIHNIITDSDDYNSDFSWSSSDRSNDVNLGLFDTNADNIADTATDLKDRTIETGSNSELYLLSSDGSEKVIIRLLQQVTLDDTTTLSIGDIFPVEFEEVDETGATSSLMTDIQINAIDGNKIEFYPVEYGIDITRLSLDVGDAFGITTTTGLIQNRIGMGKMMLVDCFENCNTSLADDGDVIPDHWVPHFDYSDSIDLLVSITGTIHANDILSSDSFKATISSVSGQNISLEDVLGEVSLGETLSGPNGSVDVEGIYTSGLIFYPISHSDIHITDFNLYIMPFNDPYKNFAANNSTVEKDGVEYTLSPHMQPNVLINLGARHIKDSTTTPSFVLQTSVSSRVYSNVSFPRT